MGTSLDVMEEPKSTLVSRNITILGRRTSVRLEPEMWTALRNIAKRERCSIHDICSLIALRKREHCSLTAAIRVFLMLYFKASSTEEGHTRAGHGNFQNMIQRAGIAAIDVLRKMKKEDPAMSKELDAIIPQNAMTPVQEAAASKGF